MGEGREATAAAAAATTEAWMNSAQARWQGRNMDADKRHDKTYRSPRHEDNEQTRHRSHRQTKKKSVIQTDNKSATDRQKVSHKIATDRYRHRHDTDTVVRTDAQTQTSQRWVGESKQT